MQQSLKVDGRYRLFKGKLKSLPYVYQVPFYYLPNFAERMGFTKNLPEADAEAVREEILKFMQIKKGDAPTCFDAWMREVFKMNDLRFESLKLVVDGTETAQKINGLLFVLRECQPAWVFGCFLAPLNYTQMFSNNAEDNYGKTKIFTGA
jgi:hypothetical protein